MTITCPLNFGKICFLFDSQANPLMNEQKIIPITTEQPLTIILPDTTCQLVLKYEQQGNSVESENLKNKEAIKMIGNQVSRYANKSSVFDIDTIPEVCSLQKSDDFDKELRIPNTPIKFDEKRYDVFVSYNSRNIEDVYPILIKLRDDKRIAIWFDKWEIRPGDLTLKILQMAIGRAECILLFIGNNCVGQWQDEEWQIAILKSVKKGVRTIPVLLPGVKAMPEEFLFLELRQRVCFKSVDDEEALQNLIWGIKDIKPERKTFS